MKLEDKPILKANYLSSIGNIEEAKGIYETVLRMSPGNKLAQRGLAALNEGKVNTASITPPQRMLDDIAMLFNQGEILSAVHEAKAALQEYPNSYALWSALGVASRSLGHLEDSRCAFIRATEIDPEHSEGFNNLGVVLKSQGHLSEAIMAFRKSISLNPKDHIAFYNMANALMQSGDLEGALAYFKKSLSLKPRNPEACNNMGNLLKALGRLDEAIASYKNALSLKPDYADAYNNMGDALKGEGKLDEALASYNCAVLLEDNIPEIYYKMGKVLSSQGKFSEAVAHFNKAISNKPDYTDAYNDMGYALRKSGNLAEALNSFKKALSLRSGDVNAYHGIGNILEDRGAPDAAIECYRKIISLNPNYAPAYSSLGRSFASTGKLDEAVAHYNKALSMGCEPAKTYLSLSLCLKDKGDLDGAVTYLNKSLSLNPLCAESYRLLSTLTKYQEGDGNISFILDMLKSADLSDSDRVHLHFALAKMHQDIGDFKNAFHHYVEAGAFKKREQNFSFDEEEELYSSLKYNAPIISSFDFEVSTENSPFNPIFILGMPRSGTTLVEQIISCHSQVEAAGELSYLALFATPLAKGDVPPTKEEALKIRASYFKRVGEAFGGKRFISDKMPHNFRFIGIIAKVFPEAKIVHVMRDPAATCWSNFSNHFPARGLGYSNDINDTVRYYELYRDMMKTWGALYPDRIYNLDYEKLTIDQETETRKLIEHLGLTWEDACLYPHENSRSVQTASQQQVRKKVYKGSADVWRKFEPFLNGAFDNL